MGSDKLFRTVTSELQNKNSGLNAAECAEKATCLKSFPRRLVFELTNKCNFNCIMCGRESAEFKTHDLPITVVKACGSLYQYTEEVTLHGWGEGTLHPNFIEILEYLNTFKPLRKYFVTNGSTLPKIMNALFDHHVDVIAVSLDGATAESNNSIRTGGNFEREVGSVKKLLEERTKQGLDYPYVNFVFTAMNRNIHEVPKLVELAHSIGIPEVKVVYLTIFEEALKNETLLDKQEIVRAYFDKARERAAALGVKLKLPEIQGEGEAGEALHKPCVFPWRDFFIGSDGFVRPCQSSAEKILNIGSYASIEEAWNSEPMQKLRACVNDEALMSENCRKCYHSSCANWNLKSSFMQLGNSFAPQWGSSRKAAKPSKSAAKPATKPI